MEWYDLGDPVTCDAFTQLRTGRQFEAAGTFASIPEDERTTEHHSNDNNPGAYPDAEHSRVWRGEAPLDEALVLVGRRHDDGLQSLVEAQKTDPGPSGEERQMHDEYHGQDQAK